MKKALILMGIVAAMAASMTARSKVIDNPPFLHRAPAPIIEVKKVELQPDSTVIHFRQYNLPGHSFKVKDGDHIVANGEELKVVRSNGVVLNEKMYPDSTMGRSYSLTFPPLPKGTNTIDFYGDGQIEILGIDLKNREPKYDRSGIPAHLLKPGRSHKEDLTPLPMPEWTDKKAYVKGRIVGRIPGRDYRVEIYPRHAFGSMQASRADVDSTGAFSLEVPMYATHAAMFANIADWYGVIVLTAADTLNVYFDLVENSHCISPREFVANTAAGYRYPNNSPLYCEGPLADVNNEISTIPVKKHLWNVYVNMNQNKRGTMTPDEFRADLDAWGAAREKDLDALDLNPRSHRVIQLHDCASQLCTTFYTDFLKNDPDTTWNYGLEYTAKPQWKDVNSLEAAYSSALDQMTNFLNSAWTKDSTVHKDFISAMVDSTMTQTQIDLAVLQKNREYISKILGSDRSPILDALDAQYLTSHIEREAKPLDSTQIAWIQNHHNPYVRDFCLKENDRFIAELERRRNSSEYNIMATPSNSGEEFLAELAQKHGGKVMVIDFWQTWCGPCRSAIKQIEPHKEALKKEGVVFIYAADERSPEDTWNNMISGIPGDHYRLKNKQTDELFDKFRFTGWPSYVVVDKQGRFVHTKLGYHHDDLMTAIRQSLDGE